MKTTNRILTVLLTLAVFICTTGFTANASTRAASITFVRTFDAKVPAGYAITREAVTMPEGLTVVYTSSNSAVATVNENGRVVGKTPGNAVISASAGGLTASYNVMVHELATTTVFDGFNVTVLDQTTPAVSARGRINDRNVMCFVSAAGNEVGAISHGDYNAIIQKNQRVVNLSGGGTWGAPPVDGKNWEEWFADEFNKYRGLNAGSREAAVATNQTDVIASYRQEVIRIINIEREKVGVQPLYADEITMEYSQTRAKELSLVDHDSYMNHIRPNGEKYWVELYEAHGIVTNENSAIGSMTPSAVVERWMNSTGHRANILNKEAYAIGVGCHWTGANYNWNLLFVW